MVASVRIGKYVQKALKCDATWKAEIGDARDLDNLIIINGAYGFSKVLEPLSHAILGAKQIIWCQNDYTIVPPSTDGTAESPFRKAFVTRKQSGQAATVFWSTCHKWSNLPGSHYVNWNQLTFDPDYDESVIKKRRKNATEDLYYYGSYRSHAGMRKTSRGLLPFVGKNGRDRAFERYFAGPFVPTTVSSPAFEKFAVKFPNITVIDAIRNRFFDETGSHGLGLYIEDVKSSEEFHSPANRFYEMLSAGLPMVFQPESVTQLKKAGIDVTEFVAKDAAIIKGMMKDREEIGKMQRKRWVGDDPGQYAASLKKQFATARKATGL
jgi:hypothetical protein